MTLVDDNLLPSHRYVYTALLLDGGKSAQTIAETMDTTSHDFSFETFLLGDGTGSSCLYDVAIINDTLAYAVGEIYQDYTKDYQIYNAAKWNGKTWELMRIQFLDFCNQTSMYPYPAKAIWAFNENDIWISSGSQIVRWNGQAQSWPECIPVSVLKLWGENPSSIYAVGYNGLIAHYDGRSWNKIESGTELPIPDIWGSYNGKSRNYEIICVASNEFTGDNSRLLKISGSGVNDLPNKGLSWSLHTLWFISGRKYIIGGDGLYISREIPEEWNREVTMPPYYKTSVQGNGINDIIVVGAFGLCMHYNGISWQNYQEYTYMSNGAFCEAAIRGNIVIAVGGMGRDAIAMVCKR
jgi:hypothetical protein